MINNALIAIILFFGIIFIVVELVKLNMKTQLNHQKIIYRYIPRTFEEEQEDPVSVSEVFNEMFSQPSPWVQSIRTYDREKQERVNKYFITQL